MLEEQANDQTNERKIKSVANMYKKIILFFISSLLCSLIRLVCRWCDIERKDRKTETPHHLTTYLWAYKLLH